MLESIRRFFTRSMDTGASSAADAADSEKAERDRLHVAACALLLELAHADDTFTERERTQVENAIRRHLDMEADAARELIELAEEERRNAIDLYQFTSLVRDNYDLGQKTVLAEIMWGVILADGEIHKDESYMMRKIGNLLDLEPGYLAHARKKVMGQAE